MPTPESVQAAVTASLDAWKRQLLDLTRRNRALNFRPLKVSTLAIVDEPPAEVFRLLSDDGRTMTFAPAAPKTSGAASPSAPGPAGPAPPPDGDAATGDTVSGDDPFSADEHMVRDTAFAPYAPTALAETHTDLVLQTTVDADTLDRSLRRIDEQARLSLEEQGVNTLCLALGLLHYTEVDGSDDVFRAPLVLLPVSLRRGSARAPYVLEAADDEPMVNPALTEWLRRQFDVTLPDLPLPAPAAPDAPPPSLQTLFVAVQETIARIPQATRAPAWKLTDDVFLGLFSFQKLVMYKDLEAHADAVTQHRLVTQLITRRGRVPGGGVGLPDDVRQLRLDESCPPERGAHVVDADGSQQRALAAVDMGHDLVVEGPPGTGKSQTITNLVAQALHAGKRVLFVAEKMAALDVVHQRLQAAGLGEFCLELHSTRASKREVIRSIAAALDASLQPAPAAEDVGDKLRDVREGLGAYVTALHAPFGALAASPYAAYGELARVLDAPRIDWTGPSPDIVTRTQLDAAVTRLDALVAAAAAAGDIAQHPWRDTSRTFYPQDQVDAIVELARDVASRVPEVQAAAVRATEATGVPLLERLEDLPRVRAVADVLGRAPGMPRAVMTPTIDAAPVGTPPGSVDADASRLIAAVREWQRLDALVRERFVPAVTDEDHAADIAYIESKTGIVASLFWWLDARQRAIRARWKTYRQPTYSASALEQAHDLKQVVALRAARRVLDDLDREGRAWFGAHWQGPASQADELQRGAAWVVEFRTLATRDALPAHVVDVLVSGPSDLSTVEELDARVRALADAGDRLARLLQWRADRPQLAALTLTDVEARARGFVDSAVQAPRWGAFVAACADVRDTVAAPIVALAEAGRIAWHDVTRASLRAFWFGWLARAVEGRPPLARFQALTHEQRIEEFRALDRRVLADNQRRLVAGLRARVQARLRDPDVDAAMPVLRRELAKQRGHRPIRETLRLAHAAVSAIKPVFLMSPLSVAQFTPGASCPFDLVVFDEASQLPPEDAVGAIARGAQLVVVGDPKQLPPTSFFATHLEAAPLAESDDGLDVPDAESILEAFMGCGVPMSRLKWHYRSAHESLISFSNVSFYDGDLLTFPSVEPISDALGLRFEFVSDGVYEGKGLNLVEARRVADAVVAFARDQLAREGAGAPPRSLGVGTFNLRQQLAIQDLLEAARRDDPSIEPFFDRSRPEPFFVKNLENIQGDERDVIFLSVTYAKGRDGRLRQHFGPLNGENGWRRLNVLTTRARRTMRVFSSMRASDIHEGQSKGGPLLKAFLEYAESGRLDHPTVRAAAATESPFEREVVNDLARRGHLVEPQVGVAGYRIDIGVRDPEAPGRFLIGIECDGVAYHASETARDRDRLRQQVLEARGWTIVRLWSTDWFKDRAGQMERLEAAIADARARKGEASREESEGQQGRREEDPSAPEGVEGEAVRTAAVAAPEPVSAAYVKATPPARRVGDGVLKCHRETLAAIVADVVATESPVHEDELVTRVASFWGQRTGARIRAHVLAAVAHAVTKQQVERREAFLWAPGTACVVRDHGDADISAEHIAPEVYEAALQLVLAGGRTVRRDALLAEARAHLGFERMGSTLAASLDAALQRLQARGLVGEGSAGYLRRW